MKPLLDTRIEMTRKEQEKKTPKKKSKWTTALDQTYELDFNTAKPVPDLSSIDWMKEQIIGVQRASGGSEGTFFVETSQGVLIAKRSFNISAEILCTLLALRLGLYAPKVNF